jgi:hypothetical protein
LFEAMCQANDERAFDDAFDTLVRSIGSAPLWVPTARKRSPTIELPHTSRTADRVNEFELTGDEAVH